jgi:acetyltransferase
MFGLGGIWVEVMQDVTMRLAPFAATEALSMIDEVRGRALFDGYRGRKKIDRAALSRLLERLSHWFAAAEWIAEFDLNPLVAGDGGFVILDGRIRTMEFQE